MASPKERAETRARETADAIAKEFDSTWFSAREYITRLEPEAALPTSMAYLRSMAVNFQLLEVEKTEIGVRFRLVGEVSAGKGQPTSESVQTTSPALAILDRMGKIAEEDIPGRIRERRNALAGAVATHQETLETKSTASAAVIETEVELNALLARRVQLMNNVTVGGKIVEALKIIKAAT